MSAISSSTSGISALLQQPQQTSGTGLFSKAGFAAQRQSEFASALQSAGVDSSKVGDIQSQIDAAIQSVRQNGGSSGTDQRTAIKDAVDGVLQKNGVDVSKFDAALKAQHAGHAHRGHKGGGGGDSDGDQDGSATIQSAGTTSSTGTVDQKVTDLLKALADGTAQPGDAAGIPTGSLVDVAA
jgi:hypothetical protein